MKSMDELKKQAGYRAVEQVKSDMIVGLGTGSTAKFAVERIGKLYRSGELKDIMGIPSSEQTEHLARESGVPLTTFDAHPKIDLTIDGADEVDPELNLIKGGGGALLREKILVQASLRNIIIVDNSKISPQLGTHWAIPVEVIPFARQTEENHLGNMGANVTLRRGNDNSPFLTDQGNLILDASFGPIEDPISLALKLNDRAGIMAHGLFIGLTAEVIVADENGLRHVKKSPPC